MPTMQQLDNPATVSEHWDLIIRPEAKWFDLHLADLWRYRDLIMLFVRRDFVSQFKQTILGPLWFVMQPLLSTVVFTIIFSKIAKLPTDRLPAPLFYMSGTILWGYFAGCFTNTANTFTANSGLFGKVYFPRLAAPIAIVISQMLRLGLQFLFFLAFVCVFAVRGVKLHPNAAIFLAPLLVLLMAALGLGAGIVVSSLTTKYRDLQFLVGFGVQLLMYATTVIYPLSMTRGAWRCFILANPMTAVIETFRYAFLGAGTFNLSHLAYSAGFAAVILFVGILMFTRIERTFMDTV